MGASLKAVSMRTAPSIAWLKAKRSRCARIAACPRYGMVDALACDAHAAVVAGNGARGQGVELIGSSSVYNTPQRPNMI